jgi:hypothetical protein
MEVIYLYILFLQRRKKKYFKRKKVPAKEAAIVKGTLLK